MQPTPRAMALADPVRVALGQIETLVSREQVFDPATAERVFSHRPCPTVPKSSLGPALLAYVCEHAPGNPLPLLRRRGARDYSMISTLTASTSALVSEHFPGGQVHHKRRVLATDSYLVMFKRPQKCRCPTPMSLEDYVRLPHVLTSLRRGEARRRG